MKTLKKITLASAIAAAPFMAQAELTPMDDALMGNTTGQAGVTIEINIQDTGVTVGEVEYVDEGSVLVKGVTLTGWDASANSGAGGADEVNITQKIDVLDDGSLQMINSTAPGQQLRIQVAAVELQDNTAATTNLNSELVAGVDLKLELGPTSTTTIHNVDMSTQTLADFGVTGAYGAGKSGLVIEADAAVAIRDLDVGMFGYTQAQADATYDVGAAQGTLTGAMQAGDTVAYDAATGAATITNNSGTDYTAEEGAYNTVRGANATMASAAAVKLNNITFDDGTASKGAVTVEQTIWADSTGVYIQLGAINGDLNIGGIEIGGASIGSVAVRDLNLAGLTQKIYGHN